MSDERGKPFSVSPSSYLEKIAPLGFLTIAKLQIKEQLENYEGVFKAEGEWGLEPLHFNYTIFSRFPSHDHTLFKYVLSALIEAVKAPHSFYSGTFYRIEICPTRYFPHVNDGLAPLCHALTTNEAITELLIEGFDDEREANALGMCQENKKCLLFAFKLKCYK